MKTLILLSLYFIPTIAHANCKHEPTVFNCVEYVRNYDADTITFNVPGLHPIIGEKINIRVLGIDTPEIRTKDKCEKAKAYKAKFYVQGIMKNAKSITLKNIKRGKYFRVVADVIVDGESLTEKLLRLKYGYKYHGKKKKKVNWCKYSS